MDDHLRPAPDDVGVHSSVTTAVDLGGTGAYTIPAFKHYIADRAMTDIRCFPSINSAGTLRGGLAGPIIHTPEIVDVELLVTEAKANPRLVRGFGEIHAESGAYSRWGFDVVRMAREASERTGLPLYFHTGELFEVDEARRPEPRSLLTHILAIARPGDVLGHVYSAMPDGVLGDDQAPSPALIEAAAAGLLLDIGFGINFSYATARRMIRAGVLPHVISSDVHGLFPVMHDDSALDYSLAGAFARLVALGMPFRDALAAVTVNPARVLGDEGEIGTLAIGSRADVAVLEERTEVSRCATAGARSWWRSGADPASRAPKRTADHPHPAAGAHIATQRAAAQQQASRRDAVRMSSALQLRPAVGTKTRRSASIRRNAQPRRPWAQPATRASKCCPRSRGLLDRRRVAGEGGAADVAHLVAVEAAGAVHCGTVVPHHQIMGPPGVRVNELALGGVLRQVAQEHARFGDRPADNRAGVRGEE
jgi:predicted amidohydrolase